MAGKVMERRRSEVVAAAVDVVNLVCVYGNPQLRALRDSVVTLKLAEMQELNTERRTLAAAELLEDLDMDSRYGEG